MARAGAHSVTNMKASSLEAFIDLVWSQGERHYRSFPWRHINDAYGVYLSEVMLQQTQVTRVLGRWERWMSMWPTLDSLAAASVSDVLEQWQGMGYNRRALSLKQTAQQCSSEYGGVLPHSYDELIALPGIGPATAAGIRAFAFNEPGIYLETNVRTVFIHELFDEDEYPVSDAQLRPLVEATCSTDRPRDWYYALLDYGAYLKKTVTNPSRKSSHHAVQSKFEGSRRQKRANLLRIVLDARTVSIDDAHETLDAIEKSARRSAVEPAVFESIVDDMVKEGFIAVDSQGNLCAL